MNATRSSLLDGTAWVSDGGLETDLIFNKGVDLPEFASFPLLDDPSGTATLAAYYAEYAAIASATGNGLLVETPTWRANADWGRALSYDEAALDRINQEAVAFGRRTAETSGVEATRVSGVIGPRGDGYLAGGGDPDEAAAYHAPQATSFAVAGADLVHAMTMTGAAEGIGIVRAARDAGLPVAVSFTVEIDGRLPDGTTLADTLSRVETEAPADWYGVNCAHPTHVLPGLDGGAWQERLLFFRPNASTLSHTELDEMDVLDAGDLGLLTDSAAALRSQVPSVGVLGGCCGTDSRHVGALWGVR